MIKSTLLSIGMACLAMASVGNAKSGAGRPQVTVDAGAVRGVSEAGVHAFKGIPFAAPPVGQLRWRAPQPASLWAGVRDAAQYGSDCMQVPFPSDAAPLGTRPAEDCLYLNVWKPEGGGARKLPVMVWIYGGGFVNGGASPPTYSGAELAKRGIVVVSFNYRVGRFGTFAHPQLTRMSPDGGLLANYGYMDQLAALRWVQRNIASFGGDPRDVTIVGESAGGMSVHALVTSPLTKGLFHRAVVQSGGPSGLGGATLASAESIGLAFAQSKGIAADDPQAITKLRALTADQVTDGLNMMALFAPSGPRTFSSPIVDGKIAVDTVAAYQAGRFAKVPMMVGATSNDIGGQTGSMITGARQMAALLSNQGVPVYYYRFSYVAESARTPDTKGAGHATEIPFFFNTVAVKYGSRTTAADLAAGKIASSYLVNFVKRGDPNGPGLPLWRSYSDKDKPMLDLNMQSSATLVPNPGPRATEPDQPFGKLDGIAGAHR